MTLGYQFIENQSGWQQSTYRSLRPVQIVGLDMKTHGARAIQYCDERGGYAIENFPLCDAH